MSTDTADRKAWMGILARAAPDSLARLWEALGVEPGHDWLRAPESGMVMVRGRAGATGAPFNLGEMTVTRCTLRLPDGTVGHAYVPGRDRRHAEIAALCDALLQREETRERVAAAVMAPLEAEAEARAADDAARAAATKVDFFTMVRGED